MSKNPINLALHFFLELAALAALVYWGWTTHDGLWRVVWSVGLVVGASFLWGTFRVPDDPGKAPVAVPGIVRLLLEILFFGAAVVLLIDVDRSQAALIFGVVVVLDYLLAYDRVLWLLTGRSL